MKEAQLDLGFLVGATRPPMMRVTLDDADVIGDAFAGGGGASLAQFLALGRHPTFAINHDAEAIAMHAANHPETKHYIENIYAVDPVKACEGKRVGFMWFSPDCTHFSGAKGSKPRDQKIRGLAWIVVRWAAKVAPVRIVVENVAEFLSWGPLHQTHIDGCKLIPARQRRGRDGKERLTCSKKGCHYHRPIKARRGETYRAWHRKLVHLGYTIEARVLRACDFGAPTTRKRVYIVLTRDGVMPRFPVPTHGPGRAEPYRTAAECIDWSIPCPSIFDRPEPLADKTLERIARGIRKFVLGTPRPFVMHVTHGTRAHDLNDPLPTVTGANRGELALVSPIVVKAKTHGGGGNDAMSADEPLRTITASKRGEFAIAVPYLVPATHGDSKGKADSRVHSVEEPLRTITTLGAQSHVVVPYLVHRSNGERGPKDGKPGQAPRIYDVEEPLGTIVAQGQKHALCAAVLIKNYGARQADEVQASPLDAPIGTVTSQDHHSLVACHLTKFYGTSTGSGLDEPMPTITGKGWHLGAVAAFLVRYNGQSGPQPVDQPIGTIDTTDRYSLVTVTIDGEEYVIVDIGMRMLAPRELFRAQGFGDDYVIDPIGPNGKPLSKTAQVRMCGNSVSPVMGAAMIRAQFEEAA